MKLVHLKRNPQLSLNPLEGGNDAAKSKGQVFQISIFSKAINTDFQILFSQLKTIINSKLKILKQKHLAILNIPHNYLIKSKFYKQSNHKISLNQRTMEFQL